MMAVPYIPGYTLCDKLGKGTNAVVYKALKKNDSSKTVAVKCINKRILNKNGSDNLVSEISILKELKHEYIVQLIDFTWDSNYIYLILEFCPGGDLSSYIKKHRCLDEQVVHRFLQQLALALQFLYKKSILHMDLKPPNILLTSNRNPKLKLADFGFAKCIEGTVSMDYLRGSLLYMAPEVFLSGIYSSKCDLWSVGVIIYECLMGLAPFHSDSLDSLKAKIVDQRSIPVPTETPIGISISNNCVTLLSGLLQRDYDRRLSYEEFFQHPFVDISHAPSQNSFEISERILKMAKRDEEIWRERFNQSSIGPRQRRINNILELNRVYKDYVDGLSHMIAAIHYEDSDQRRNLLKESFQYHFDHAEALKKEIDSLNQNVINTDDDMVQLVLLCENDDEFKNGIEKLRQFYESVERNQIKKALELFTDIFETLSKKVKEDTNRTRKQLFYAQLEYAMDVAENLKSLSNADDMPELKRRRDSVKADFCLLS